MKIMTHSSQRYINDYSSSEGYFLRIATDFMNRINWKKRKKEVLDKKSKEVIRDFKSEGNKNFKNELIVHYKAY